MASLLDVLKDLPSEIRYDIFVKVFDEVTETGQGVPSILPALRGERKLYFEALSIYYSLTTIRLSHGNLPTFLTLSQPTKDLVRKICLDIRWDLSPSYSYVWNRKLKFNSASTTPSIIPKAVSLVRPWRSLKQHQRPTIWRRST